MTFEEIRNVMQKEYDKDNNNANPCWLEFEAAPHGVIENEEQYNYIIRYSENSTISLDGMKPYSLAKGMYLKLGNYFGGAAFYFTLIKLETAKKMQKKYPNIYPKDLSWSYGKYGRVNF